MSISLCRAWAHPDPATSPEVFAALHEMDARGVDLLVDVHGDEELPVSVLLYFCMVLLYLRVTCCSYSVQLCCICTAML